MSRPPSTRSGAAILLVLVSPLLLVLMIGVWIDSPGPAIFRQTRVGKDGRLFEVFKLRTMVSDAEDLKAAPLVDNEYDGLLFKIRNDPRVTRFGGLLRRSSLDELPQLVNVLRGEMSLVGPRPSLPVEVAAMEPDTLRRFKVRPGHHRPVAGERPLATSGGTRRRPSTPTTPTTGPSPATSRSSCAP